MCDGSGLNRVQRFLLGTLRPTTLTKYIEALNNLNAELQVLGSDWHSMDEEAKDQWLAEWILDGFEAGGSKNEYSRFILGCGCGHPGKC